MTRTLHWTARIWPLTLADKDKAFEVAASQVLCHLLETGDVIEGADENGRVVFAVRIEAGLLEALAKGCFWLRLLKNSIFH